MKLAEALLLRGDIQKKLASLRERIGRNGVVQEGDTPHEDPNVLLKEAFVILDEYKKLVASINIANLKHKLPDGRTLTEAIAHRDTLTARHAIISSAIESTQKEPDRYSVREIKWIATMDVAKLQSQLEEVAKQIRELNGSIQETNWRVEL